MAMRGPHSGAYANRLSLAVHPDAHLCQRLSASGSRAVLSSGTGSLPGARPRPRLTGRASIRSSSPGPLRPPDQEDAGRATSSVLTVRPLPGVRLDEQPCSRAHQRGMNPVRPELTGVASSESSSWSSRFTAEGDGGSGASSVGISCPVSQASTIFACTSVRPASSPWPSPGANLATACGMSAAWAALDGRT